MAQPINTELIPERRTLLPKAFFRYSAVELLIALILLFVSAPLVQKLPGADLVEPAVITLVLLSAVLVIGARRRTFITALVVVIPVLFARWAHHFFPEKISPFVYLVPATLFFAFVVARLIRFILRAVVVDINVLCAGLSGYLLLGYLWMALYLAVSHWNAAAFTMPAGTSMDPFSALYFSFITLSTVGYGDIAPASRSARMFAAMEAIVGLFYVAVLISRLVAIYSTPPPPAEKSPPEPR
jgi:hypothetical protein